MKKSLYITSAAYPLVNIMLPIRVIATFALLILAVAVTPVFAQYASSDPNVKAPPILGTTGAPALSNPKLFSGAIDTLYANGRPVHLATLDVNLKLCSGDTCVTVPTTLTQTDAGTYTYTITPPLTGTVTIYITAGDLQDTYGRVFPTVDTQIGTYTLPSGTSLGTGSSSENIDSTRPVSQPVSNVQGANPPRLTREAVTPAAPTQQSPILQVLSALTVLGLSAVGILFFPRPH